jgi:hypothetical protein
MLWSRAKSTTFWRVAPEADGIAISTSSGRWSRKICGSSSVVPRTRTPCMRMFFLRGSSSTIPIGVSARDFNSSRRTSWPASPAPTTSTSLPCATSEPGVGRSRSVRAAMRDVATSASRISQSMTATERGTRRSCSGTK